MTILTNVFQTFDAKGNREDLIDEIFLISPTDTPFQANVSKNKASAITHEWQTDTLAAAAANAQIEGDDSSTSGFFATTTATSRLNNITQISRKTVIVSGTQDAVNKAGRKKEIIYQLMKRAKELRRDMEFVLLNNQTPVPVASSNTTTARALRPINSWYSTNTSRGATGSSGSTTTAATDGTQRVLTESLVKTEIQSAWTQGGDPDLIMTGPFNKTVMSGFTGNNTRIQDTTDARLQSAIDRLAA